MTIKELSTKLRKAADLLDDLVGVNLDKPTKNETVKTSYKIRKKLHWTQMSKNKAKVKKILYKANKIRNLGAR